LNFIYYHFFSPHDVILSRISYIYTRSEQTLGYYILESGRNLPEVQPDRTPILGSGWTFCPKPDPTISLLLCMNVLIAWLIIFLVEINMRKNFFLICRCLFLVVFFCRSIDLFETSLKIRDEWKKKKTSAHFIFDRNRRVVFEFSNIEIHVCIFRRSRDIARNAHFSTIFSFLFRSLDNFNWINRIENRFRRQRFLWTSAFFRSVIDIKCFCVKKTRKHSEINFRQSSWINFLIRIDNVVNQLSTLSFDSIQQNVVLFYFFF
jgi:hypothetical protein